MLNVKIICVGKLKEKFLRDGCAEYIKRLSRFARLEITELPEERLPDDPSPAQVTSCLETEGKTILGKIPRECVKIALCVEGTGLSSEELAEKLGDLSSRGLTAVFIIGSAYGLSDEVKKAADIRLSLSKMTFTHQMSRMLLLEQIYRAMQISSGGKYHKA